MLTITEEEQKQVHISIIAFITALLYAVFAVLEIFFAPIELKNELVVLHLSITPINLLIVSWLAYKGRYFTFMMNLYTISPLIAAANNLYISSIFPESMAIYNGELYLMVFWVFTVSGLSFKRAVIIASIITVASIFKNIFAQNLSNYDLVFHIFWLMSSFWLGIMGASVVRLLQQRLIKKQIALEEALINKDILFNEVHHRVKNNLQIISSLLAMQGKKIKNEQAKEVFLKNRYRVDAMSMVHEQLYTHEKLDTIQLDAYIKSLSQTVLLNSEYEIESIIEMDKIQLSLDIAIPLGLALNEILTNSVKYAFTQRTQNSIRIKALQEGSHLSIKVSDNGKGMDLSQKTDGFGMNLVESLIKVQLHGNVKVFNKDGLCVLIEIEI